MLVEVFPAANDSSDFKDIMKNTEIYLSVTKVMIDWPNVTASSQQDAGLKPEELQRSKCVLGFTPVVYYSILLCVGVPGMLHPNDAQTEPGFPTWTCNKSQAAQQLFAASHCFKHWF